MSGRLGALKASLPLMTHKTNTEFCDKAVLFICGGVLPFDNTRPLCDVYNVYLLYYL